jgi:protein-lysine N-methyltransferase EEF2KMT
MANINPEGSHSVVTNATVVHCWSGPRCVSTSLMYSFAQRADTTVLDEPLYAHWLRLNPHAALSRPYADQVLEAQSHDGDAVMGNILARARMDDDAGRSPITFVKHMAKHRQGLDPAVLSFDDASAQGKGGADVRCVHFLLVRHPSHVLRSFNAVVPPSLLESCFPALLELYSELRQLTGSAPPIVLSEELVKAPAPTLRALCAALEIPFDPAMLSWPPGPKPEIDGVWGRWWYGTTWRCTGFDETKTTQHTSGTTTLVGGEASTATSVENTEAAEISALVEECEVIYDFLKRKSLRSATVEAITAGPRPSLELSTGTHAHVADPRNQRVLIGIRDGVSGRFELFPRPCARVNVFDAGFMLGDGVWEGMRLHRGVLLFAEMHLRRMMQGAKALDMRMDVDVNAVRDLVYQTVDANRQHSGVHIRVMLTRGLKTTG